MSLRRLPILSSAARDQRAAPTDAESALWRLLRGRSLLGWKFRRQVPCDRFVLDFYCHELRLAVEVDGGVHLDEQQRDRDLERTARLDAQGIQVLRFFNVDVMTRPHQVLAELEAAATARRSAIDNP
jgi:very-short-patch-repair endonuclease